MHGIEVVTVSFYMKNKKAAANSPQARGIKLPQVAIGQTVANTQVIRHTLPWWTRNHRLEKDQTKISHTGPRSVKNKEGRDG